MTATAVPTTDPRVSWPILTTSQVAALTDVPTATLKGWTRGSGSILHTLPNRRGWPTIPFIGLVEAEVAGSLLQFLPPLRVKSILRSLKAQHGDDFTLDAPHLVTDLSNTFLREGEDLTRIPDSQGAFFEVIRKELRTLRIGVDGKVEAFTPTRLDIASVDPRYNGGSLSITRTRTPVASIVGSLRAGEQSSVVAADYGLTVEEVERIAVDLEWSEAAA
jgi:uncharacterized protein (DUF433 family)